MRILLAGMFPSDWRGGKRRRGFTLVELAVVMVIVGLLMGVSLIPMRTLEERRQLRAEMQKMEKVRDAIVGYAIRHRTRERMVKFIPLFGPRNEWVFRLPGGRPYLPCPDFDGDGLEDRFPPGRNGFMQGFEVRPDLTVTLMVGSFQGEKSMAWMDPYASGYQGHIYGECMTVRGTVPWRTLGVEPSDGWGNRHTYFADPVFSNAIFGFDRQTIADIYDSRVPSAPEFHSPAERYYRTTQLRHSNLRETSTVPPERKNASGLGAFADAGCPAAICDSHNCAPYVREHSIDYEPTIRRCAWGDVNGRRIFKAGGVTPGEIFPMSSGGKYFPANTVTDGLPFVLVSHGPNGRFAVNHWATLNNPQKTPVCNLAWGNPDEFGEIRIPAGDQSVLYEAVNGARIRSIASDVRCPTLLGEDGGNDNGIIGVDFNPSHFVWQPPGVSDKSDFDDLLVWMTRDELSVAVPGRIPPLPTMVIGYFP